MEIINRDEAEQQIREAIDDYLAEGILQEILDVIYGGGEFLVSENFSEEDEDA